MADSVRAVSVSTLYLVSTTVDRMSDVSVQSRPHLPRHAHPSSWPSSPWPRLVTLDPAVGSLGGTRVALLSALARPS